MRIASELVLALIIVSAAFVLFSIALGANAAGHRSAYVFFAASVLLLVGSTVWLVRRISYVLKR